MSSCASRSSSSAEKTGEIQIKWSTWWWSFSKKQNENQAWWKFNYFRVIYKVSAAKSGIELSQMVSVPLKIASKNLIELLQILSMWWLLLSWSWSWKTWNLKPSQMVSVLVHPKNCSFKSIYTSSAVLRFIHGLIQGNLQVGNVPKPFKNKGHPRFDLDKYLDPKILSLPCIEGSW